MLIFLGNKGILEPLLMVPTGLAPELFVPVAIIAYLYLGFAYGAFVKDFKWVLLDGQGIVLKFSPPSHFVNPKTAFHHESTILRHNCFFDTFL